MPKPHDADAVAPFCEIVITWLPTEMLPLRDVLAEFWLTTKLTVAPLNAALNQPPVAVTTGAAMAQPDCVMTENAPVPPDELKVAVDAGLSE